MKYRVTDSTGKIHYYNDDKELLEMLNSQFDLMAFELV